MLSRVAAAVAIASLTCAAGSAIAVAGPLPDGSCGATYGGVLETVYSGGATGSCPQSATYNNPGRALGWPSASTTVSASAASGAPLASVSTTLGPGAFYDADADGSAYVQYYIEVAGPQGSNGTAVPVVASGSVSAQGVFNQADTNGASAFVTVAYGQDFTYDVLSESASAGSPSSLSQSENETVPYSASLLLTSGTLYRATLIANAGLNSANDYSAQSAEASADPLFTLSPTYAAMGYSLEYSSGFVPVPPSVPSPPSAWLMLAGLVGLGAMRGARIVRQFRGTV